MTKLTSEQVAAIAVRNERKGTVSAFHNLIVARADIAALLADRASLVAELKAHRQVIVDRTQHHDHEAAMAEAADANNISSLHDAISKELQHVLALITPPTGN